MFATLGLCSNRSGRDRRGEKLPRRLRAKARVPIPGASTKHLIDLLASPTRSDGELEYGAATSTSLPALRHAVVLRRRAAYDEPWAGSADGMRWRPAG